MECQTFLGFVHSKYKPVIATRAKLVTRYAGGAAVVEALERRALLNSAFALIQLDDLRNDPLYSSIDGSGVGVVVIDSGLDSSHPELRGGYRGGVDFILSDSFPAGTDPQGHGTHVAGTIGARNRQIGVAPAVGLLGVNTGFSDGRVDFGAVERGIYWAIENQALYNIRAINMSLGASVNLLPSIDLSAERITIAISRAEAAGITVVSAAGNDYIKYQQQGLSYPAVVSTLAVGAVTDHVFSRGIPDDLALFSQRFASTSRMIVAPGVEIQSTYPGNRVESMSGTSMAAPTVTGVVALMQDAAMTFAGRYLSPAEVRDIVVTSGNTVGDFEHPRDGVTNSNANYKRLNAYEAVRLVRSRLAPGSGPPVEIDPGNSIPEDLDGTSVRSSPLSSNSDGSIVFGGRGRIGFDAGGVRVGPKDVDLFRFSVASPSLLAVQLGSDNTAPADFDTYLRLFNGSGVEIASNDNDTGNFSALASTLTPGTYFIGVTGSSNRFYALDDLTTRVDGAQGNYTIVAVVTNDAAQDRDGTIARAPRVAAGSTLTPARIDGAIGLDSTTSIGGEDVDFVRVQAPDSGFLLIDLDSLGLNYSDTFLRLFAENGQQLALSDDSPAQNAFGQEIEGSLSNGQMKNLNDDSFAGRATDSFVRFAVTRGQVVYVAVANYENRGFLPTSFSGRNGSGPQGTYSLFLAFSSNDVNGSIGGAVEISVPTSAIGEIGTDQGSLITGQVDADFFHIRVASGQAITINVDSTRNYSGNPSPFDSTLSLYDSSGKLLGFNDDDDGQDPRLIFFAEANTDYYIAATGFGNTGFDPFAAGSGTGGATGRYRISFAGADVSEILAISDDSTQAGFGGIRTVSAGFASDFELGTDEALVIGDDDIDLYRYVANASGILAVYATRIDDNSADAVVRLFDAQSNEITSTVDAVLDERNDNGLFANILQGRTYYIGISGRGPGALTYNANSVGSSSPGSTGSYQLTVGFGTQRPLVSAPIIQRVMNGSQVTGFSLAASSATARGISFAIDFNRDGRFGEGENIGADLSSSDGFTWTHSIDRRWAPGSYLIGAVGIDSNGLSSPLATTSFDIRPNYAHRIFYPEGWANEQSIDQFIPLVNPTDSQVNYRVIAHYERRPGGDTGAPLSIIVAEGTIASQSRGGVSITTRGGIGRSLVELERGYALEVQSDGPLGAILAHYDNFNPLEPASGVATGEALTNVVSTSWFFPQVTKNPGTNFEFLLFFNPNDQAADVTVAFIQNGSQITSVTFPVYANNRWGLAMNDLPALSNGAYGIVVTSTRTILAAHSAYTTNGRGDSSIGVPGQSGGTAPTAGTFPFIDQSSDLTAQLAFLNPGTLSTSVTLTARDEAGSTQVTSIVVPARGLSQISLAWASSLGSGPLSVEYSATSPIAATVFQNSTNRGDSTFYPASSVTARTWAIADAYLYRSQVGTRYFENLNVANPSNSAALIDVDFLLYDFRSPAAGGNSIRLTRSYLVQPHGMLSIPLHASDSLVVTHDTRPEVHFSLVVRSATPIYATFTHWDLNQGGGWDSWATPVG